MSKTLWLVSVDNGECSSDHSTTPVAVCENEDQARRLEARINQWLCEANDAFDHDKYELPTDWIGVNPWPLGGEAPSDARVGYGREAKAWIVELPEWASHG